jgi:hypothetical protein
MTSLAKPQKKIELFSGNYFAACTIGGIIGILTAQISPVYSS